MTPTTAGVLREVALRWRDVAVAMTTTTRAFDRLADAERLAHADAERGPGGVDTTRGER